MSYQSKIFLVNWTPRELTPCKISHICCCNFNPLSLCKSHPLHVLISRVILQLLLNPTKLLNTDFRVLPRMLKSLAGCLTELCVSDFYWTFYSILAFFDILAALSISRIFPSGLSGWWKSSCSDIPRTIIKFDYAN